MLKALLRMNVAAMLNWLTGGSKRAKKEKPAAKGKLILYAALMIYALGVFAWLFAMIFSLLAEPLYQAGTGWLFFVYVYIMAFAIMFIFSVFAAKNRLYEAKDNDLLLSLPIPSAYILGSRMLLLWSMNLLSGLLVFVPALVVFMKAVPFDLKTLVYSVVLFLALSLFALAVSSLFGWLLSVLSSKMRKKALFETMFSLVFLAAYLIIYMRMNEIVQGLIANNSSIAVSMSSVFLLYHIGLGAAGNTVSFLLAFAVFIVPFVIVYVILSKTFIKTATSKRGVAKVKYEAVEQKVSAPKKALLKREFARFFSSSTCIVNNGLGAIFLIVGAVVMLIYKQEILAVLSLDPSLAGYAVGALVVAATMMAGMVQPTSCLVSLEGRSLWIVQSMPVHPAEPLLAKLKVSLILYLPPVAFCMLCGIFVLGADAETAVLALLLALTVVVIMGETGLIANVNHPMLDWQTETQAVKSGVAVLLCMLYDLGIDLTLGLGGYLLIAKAGLDLKTVLTVFLVLTVIAARLLYNHILKTSAQKFAFL